MNLAAIRILGVVSCVIALGACGGGSDNGGSSAASSTAPAAAINITTQPQSQTIVEGQIATFQVLVSSNASISYQWQINGSAVAGATAATFTTPVESDSADGSEVQVQITAGSTSMTAGPVTLHVYSETSIPAPTQYIIDPAATDASISDSYGMHYAYFNSAVSPKGKLFLFLPGTGAQPRDYLLIPSEAANNGFHAIGLAYQNSALVTAPCATSSDLNCPGDFHEATLTGADSSTLVSVTPADSLENRLIKVLLYLSQQYPQQGWGTYLDANGNIQWNLIRVAGHSQGGSLSGYIGKQFTVDRVSLLSAPDDQVGGDVAAWITASGATDASRYYGFAHMQDQLIPWAVIQQNWPALQMSQFGDYVSVDNQAAPPYSSTHMLYSDLTINGLVTLLTYHDITAVDVTTPTDSNGLPTYRHAWQYLCFL